jgi:hypothetical protein
VGNRTLKYLTPTRMDKDCLRETLTKACDGTLHVLDDARRSDIKRHQRHMALTACLIGFVCNLCVGIIENSAMWATGNAGLWENYYECNNRTDDDRATWIGDWPP